ncbi:hypothetical protein Q4489_04440 [Thalassotalea sp. 1_MG-2023]|uniref:hypothetical protein n=1 Tax=Thalassotalea sp. 1_MG-2023 TaxID=3062680 RepID=UPI0026E47499|nr:hypothetical protein [Thalassotalea sp. 1_MG-2023]MDO6426246.1 hypothetical protein [Thalassotalea sp. 1_MG-2023]
MQFPPSFNTDRNGLAGKTTAINSISLNSYETPTALSSAKGALLLAKSIEDLTRQQRPTSWNALVLYAIAEKPEQLAEKLETINEKCPLMPFINAQQYAQSLSTINEDKTTPSTGNEQSREWQQQADNRAIPALNDAYNDASLALVESESQNVITTLDNAITEAETLKAERDIRLAQTKFNAVSTSIKTQSITANSARGLANAIKKIGNNQMHWAYIVYTGSTSELQPITELFT